MSKLIVWLSSKAEIVLLTCIFFKVTMARDDHRRQQLDVQEFIRLTNEHEGEYANCNPLDGNEHNYIELGHLVKCWDCGK